MKSYHFEKNEPNRNELKFKPVRKLGALALAIGLTLFACSELSAGQGGSDSPERFGEPNPNITAVELYEDGNLRSDPIVGKGDAMNLIGTVPENMTIGTPDGVLTFEDEYNGTWYGINKVDLETQLSVGDDNDNWIWINEQRAEAVENNIAADNEQ